MAPNQHFGVIMLNKFVIHNQFKTDLNAFSKSDPHLSLLSNLAYQYQHDFWKNISEKIPGIYILTGGRQVGKSTACKQLIQKCLKEKILLPQQILYLPCDEIYNASELSTLLRFFITEAASKNFLLIVDEITFVKNWDRVIKALADEGHFKKGLCLLTGSDTLILKEAAMRFPGRRGKAAQTDFHLHPLCFREYAELRISKTKPSDATLSKLFQDYLLCGGYLRAINDIAKHKEITAATFTIYEQWILGDFLKLGKNESILLTLLAALVKVGPSQISYSSLTQKMGLVSKETVIDYARLLERMDILINLQAFDKNKKQGFPRKNRKFHFFDPFIYHTICRWLERTGYLQDRDKTNEAILVEACVAAHSYRNGKTFYFKGSSGEVDVIWLIKKRIQAIEVKWTKQLRPNDLKMLEHFENSLLLLNTETVGNVGHIKTMPVYRFLFEIPCKDSK
jgi:predicted AAA+ superfamily ATPase